MFCKGTKYIPMIKSLTATESKFKANESYTRTSASHVRSSFYKVQEHRLVDYFGLTQGTVN